MRRRWPCVAAAVLVLLAGCGAPAGPPTSLPSRSTAPSPPPPASSPPADDCPDVEFLGLRGQGQPIDEASGVGQEVLGVARVVESRLAERGLRTTLVAVRHPARSGSDADYTADLRRGVAMTRTRIDRIARRCPETGVVLVGFSMGAQVVHRASAGLPQRLRSHVAAVGLLGDPLRDPGAAVDQLALGTGTADGTGSNGPGPGFGDLSHRVVSVCVVEDNVCNVGPGGRVGDVSEAHRHGYETQEASEAIGAALVEKVRT